MGNGVLARPSKPYFRPRAGAWDRGRPRGATVAIRCVGLDVRPVRDVSFDHAPPPHVECGAGGRGRPLHRGRSRSRFQCTQKPPIGRSGSSRSSSDFDR